MRGRRVLVTRPEGQGSLEGELKRLGAEVLSLPAIRIAPPADPGPLQRAARRLREGSERPDIILFTSPNGVRAFFARLRLPPKAAGRLLRGIRLYAVGPRTADAMRGFGVRAALPKGDYRGEGLARLLSDVKGKRVLFPRAQAARDALPDSLRRRGAEVRIVEAYRTLPERRAARRLRAALLGPRPVDAVTFTSSSTVESLLSLLTPAAARKAFRNIRAVSIGPVTSGTLRAHGITPAAEARPSTEAGLLKALAKALAPPLPSTGQQVGSALWGRRP